MKNRTVSRIFILMPLGLVAFFGCNSNSKTSVGDQPVNVQVKIVHASGEKTQYYIGTTEESVSVSLSFMTTGMVEQVWVSEGQKVKKGEKLATLNPENYSQMYQMAMAKEDQAEDAYRRLSELHQKGSLPEIKFVEIESGLAQARAAAQIAKKNLADCELFAPADGIIGRRSLEPGENVTPMKPVLTLIDIRKVHVKISVPEKEIAGIQTGQPALIRVPALNDALFEGKVAEKGVMANLVSHNYEVKILVDNPGEKLIPGMANRVYLDKEDQGGKIAIPMRSVQSDENGNRYVYLADSRSGRAVKRIIHTGSLSGYEVVVTGGLQDGDRVIVEGYQQLVENCHIQIVKEDEN